MATLLDTRGAMLRADELVDERSPLGPKWMFSDDAQAKMLRLELLQVKAELERELEDFVLNCSSAAWTCTG